MYELLHRTYRGYLTHPNIAAALLLEHGCEKVPNDVLRHHFTAAGMDTSRLGWASVQLDGGIAKALDKIEAWFAEKLPALPAAATVPAPLGALNLALLAAGPVSAATGAAFAASARAFLAAGGSVLLAEGDPLLACAAFRDAVLGAVAPRATLAYGQPLARPGLHIVASESDHWVENLTGFCGCGAHLALGLATEHGRQGHPMLPLVQVAEPSERGRIPGDDLDLFLAGDAVADAGMVLARLAAIAQREQAAVASARGFVDFQLTRGLLGLTT
jgi:altronate dehydratase